MANRVDIQYVDFSVEGNAARKISAAPRKKVRLPKEKKKTRYVLYLDPLSFCGIVLAVVMLVLMGTGVARLQEVYAQNQQMSAYVDTLSQQNTALREKFTQVCDLEEVERLALALGMIPKEDAPKNSIAMYVPPEEASKPMSLWEQIGSFLASLFA